ncbi:MAG: valine--tRNA ligase [Micavibrio sp.]
MLEKTFDPQAVEQSLYAEWEESGAFACDVTRNTAPFTVMMPPPNVTGSLHMGHALNNTLHDILVRYNRMNGKDTLWQPGTDHAGIATQMVVERQLAAQGLNRRDMGREKFLEKVWEWKEQSGGTIVNQLRRLGTTPDWSRERFTMDEGLNRAVRKAFVQLYKEGLIYKDKRLVNWDPKFHTAISDLEVIQKEIKGNMYYIRYPIEGSTERFITIATTRPETMLGDTAIIVNPEDERYQDLIGKFAILPIVGRPIPIIADAYVDKEFGTGAMKVTPAHDFNDFEVGKRHNLEQINIFDANASILEREDLPAGYAGLDRFDARKKILSELEAQELLEKVDPHTHMVPHGDRSDVVIEPYLTDQWYCNAKVLAAPTIEAVKTGKTEFVPKQWENTYFHWMENIQPWCISRQLWWGHQIPAWYGPEGSVFVEENEEEAYALAKKQFGNDVILTRDEDVLDTWFSSALWPFSTLGWPDKTPELEKYYPGDVLITGFDIIFFWVARMMMMGMHFMGDVPFRKVYIHALVRDAKGQKMSKSKGNVMDPLDLIQSYGADALRFTLTAMAAQGRDVKLSEDRVEGYRNFGTKLWNAARYCEMNNCKLDPSFDPATVQGTLNRWIVGETAKLAGAINSSMVEYKFNEGAGAVYQFVWGTFCDWYLEFSKPILQNGGETPLADETRKTTAWVLDQILILLNPYMPYITEQLYRQVADRKAGENLLKMEWPQYPAGFINAEAGEEIGWLCKMITDIRSIRADMNVPAAAKIRLLVKDASEATKNRLQTYDEIIKRLARLETIENVTAALPKGSVQTILGEATLALPIADIIDLDKERARLKKEIEKLSSDISKVDQKLSDEKFVANAPEEIIEEQKSRKEAWTAVLEKLSHALKQLEAA